MSMIPADRKLNSSQDEIQPREPKQGHKPSLSTLIDHIHLKNINNFYTNEESLFKQRIDKLNLKFYLETEKYLTNGDDIEKCQDQLFIILFKQISLYIEEIERLNKILKGVDSISNISFHNSFNFSSKFEKEKILTNQTIKTMKSTIKHLEQRLNECAINELKMKREIESLKRQLSFHNEKLQFEMTMRKAEEMKNKTLKMASKPHFVTTSGSFIEKDILVRTKTNSKDKSNDFKKPDLTLSRLFSKKRNYSDNNPNLKESFSGTTGSTLISHMTKKRYDKRDKPESSSQTAILYNTLNAPINSPVNVPPTPEFNNISINLNLNLKNTSSTNINLNTSNALNEINRNHNHKSKLDYKSPNRPKESKGYSQINSKSVSDSKPVTVKKKISNVLTAINSSQNSNSNNQKFLKTNKKNIKLTGTGSVSTSPITESKYSTIKSPTFVSGGNDTKLNISLFNNNSYANSYSTNNSLTILQETLQIKLKEYDEEIFELELLEKYLNKTKVELDINQNKNMNSKHKNFNQSKRDHFEGEVEIPQHQKAFKSSETDNQSRLFIKTDESINMSEYTSNQTNQFPFSDCEESQQGHLKNPRSANSSALNSPTSQAVSKKNYPLLTSVTIDLIDNSEKIEPQSENIFSKLHKKKLNKNRSDSSKSENTKINIKK